MALWIERNGYFAERGYCFQRWPGDAFFGTTGCTPSAAPTLPAAQDRRVKALKAEEDRRGCRAQMSRWTIPAMRAVAASGEAGTGAAVIAAAQGAPAAAGTAPDGRAVQEALRRLDIYRGIVDGVPGPDTQQAVRTWQQRQGAARTGFLTESQRRVLLGPGAAGGMVVPIGGAGPMPDYLLVAALARLPEFARHAPLQRLMAQGRLSGFFAYAPDAAEDPAAVARIAAEVARVSLPQPARVTFTLPADFGQVDAVLAALPGPVEAPVRARARIPDGDRIAPFAALPLLDGAVRLDLELEGAPRLGEVLLSPQEAEAARLAEGAGFGRGAIHVQVDMTALGPSADGLGIRLAGRVRQAEYVSATGTGPTGRHLYRAAAAASPPPMRDFGELYQALAYLGQRDGPAEGAPTRMPERLDLGTRDAGTRTILGLRHASALLANRPDLLDDFESALPLALPLLTWTERARLLRGTDVLLGAVPEDGRVLLDRLDPFERALIAARFREEARDLLAARAFDAPLPARLALPVTIEGYDLAGERLRIAPERFSLRPDLPQVGWGADAVSYRLAPSFALPTELPVPRAEAQRLIAGLALGDPQLLLEFDLPPLRDAQTGDDAVPVRVQRVTLYADPDRRVAIHEFPWDAFSRFDGPDAPPQQRLQPATRRQVAGAVLLAGGPAAEAVRDEIARRTPSHGLVRTAMRPVHAEALAERYRREAEGAPLWIPAEIDLHDIDPGARRASIALRPMLRRTPEGQGPEDARLPVGPAEDAAPRAVLPGALVLDDALLRRAGYWDADEDRLFETLATLDADDLARSLDALVRIEIASAGIGAPLRSGGGPALRVTPVIREAHLRSAGRGGEDDLRILLHAAVPAALPPDAAAPPRGIVVVRHAGNAAVPPTGLLVSCVPAGRIPRALGGLAPVGMADAPDAVVRFFAELADAPVAWVTRADCLAAGLAAAPEGMLVHRPIHAQGFVPVETLAGAPE